MPGLADRPRVVVLGGANLDILARSAGPVLPATSNPGTVVLTPGGVARNVAESLARLGTPAALVAAVGRDARGEQVLAATAAAGVDVRLVRRVGLPTGTYTAVVDADGDLVTAVADMAATESVGLGDVRRAAGLIRTADLVVLDGNLPAETVRAAAAVAAAAEVPVVLDPVSVPKAARLAGVLTEGYRWFAVTPTEPELLALASTGAREPAPAADVDAAVDRLHGLGVGHVWVRRGAAGSLLSTADGHRVALPAVSGPVVDATGAGDAMLAAFCHGVLAGWEPAAAARFGHAAAALTVASAYTVRPDLSALLVSELAGVASRGMS